MYIFPGKDKKILYPVRGECFVNPVSKMYRIHGLLIKNCNNLIDKIKKTNILMSSWIRYILQSYASQNTHHERDIDISNEKPEHPECFCLCNRQKCIEGHEWDIDISIYKKLPISKLQSHATFILCSLLLLFTNNLFPEKPYPGYDVNLIGHLKDSSSLSRHTSSFVYSLYPDINLKFFYTYPSCPEGFPSYFKNIIEDGANLTDGKNFRNNKPLTGISIYADSIVMDFWKHFIELPNASTIKFGYFVTERTLIPPAWASRINSKFDALLVADEWLVDVFKNSGIRLPIFVLPEVLDLQSLLKRPIKKAPHKKFVFGFSGGCWNRKNHQLIIDAFSQEFGKNPNVILKIHGRYINGFDKIVTACNQKNVKNIILEQKRLPREEYENFLASLDCYVTLSKGEGFSIIPREVLALGIPCIVSNNTAQTTICKSGCVYSVPSEILEPSYLIYGKVRSGFEFNCTLDDARKALRTVYKNYNEYLALATQGREWVKQYLPENLAPKYKTLVAPRTVILGDRNEITDEYIMTDSMKLFEGYKILCDPARTVFIRERPKNNPRKEPCPFSQKTR